MRGVVFVDVETSGLNPFIHEAISVGYVIEYPEGHNKEVEFSVPFDEDMADAHALEINGWGTREFPPEVTYEQAALMIIDDWDSKTIVASPTFFDMGFITALLTKVGRGPSWSHRQVIDFRSYFLGRMGHQLWTNSIGLAHISHELGIPDPLDRHGALVDARWLRDMHNALADVEQS